MTFNKEKRIVKVSVQFLSDVISVFEYGEEVFGEQAAIGFTDELFEAVDNLNINWRVHPECRHLQTPEKRYRNIILGSYLIIYKVESEEIKVLRISHGKSSISKIRDAKDAK